MKDLKPLEVWRGKWFQVGDSNHSAMEALVPSFYMFHFLSYVKLKYKIIIILVKGPSFESNQTKSQNMKTADSVLLSLFMRDNENVQHPSRPLASAWAVLSSKYMKILESLIPKDQKKI